LIEKSGELFAMLLSVVADETPLSVVWDDEVTELDSSIAGCDKATVVVVVTVEVEGAVVADVAAIIVVLAAKGNALSNTLIFSKWNYKSLKFFIFWISKGTVPVNRFNLIQKNFNADNSANWMGRAPSNWLSSSHLVFRVLTKTYKPCKDFKLLIVVGIEPVNLFFPKSLKLLK
jgi:hypothetical protein